MSIKRVLIIGGTHGNEWTGIHVVKNYAESLQKKFPELKLEFIFGNPKAYEANRRFTEEDLNRAFQYLNESRTSFEHIRAREIKDLIDREPCLVIDLHTTTANMGKTIILTDYHPLNCYLSEKISQNISDCRVIGSPDPQRKYLASQSTFNMMIEVGPIPNSIIEPRALEGTLEILEGVLQELRHLPEKLSGTLECYEEVQDVHYPVNEKKELSAYIHSGFQNQDFVAIRGKYVPFKTFTQEDITLETSEELFPIFINEAAYYPQQLAFTLCRKKQLAY